MTTDICFQGIPAWATAINNSTHLASIWCGDEEPTGSYSTVDLDFTKALGTISDKSLAQYDDFLTTITSSTTPVAGGAVYYAIGYASSPSFSSVLATGSWGVPSGNYAYQYKCWALCGTSSITRYHGYKVQVVEVINTDTVTVDIYYTDSASAQAQLNVQLTSTSTCLPASYDTNTISAVKDTVGALYLSGSFISTNSLETPKLPPSLGISTWPSSPKHK